MATATGGAKKKANPALMKKFKPDAKLSAVVGAAARPRSQYMKDLWVYIKKHKLQDPNNGQHILCKKDTKLRAWSGKDMITMFEVMTILNKHISE
jgi:upstream activation factor subunit UAF30